MFFDDWRLDSKLSLDHASTTDGKIVSKCESKAFWRRPRERRLNPPGSKGKYKHVIVPGLVEEAAKKLGIVWKVYGNEWHVRDADGEWKHWTLQGSLAKNEALYGANESTVYERVRAVCGYSQEERHGLDPSKRSLPPPTLAFNSPQTSPPPSHQSNPTPSPSGHPHLACVAQTHSSSR